MRVLQASLVAAAIALAMAATCCPNSCSGKGKCNIAGNGCVCSCFAGFLGADCSKRACPTGKAWASTGTGVDQAHVRSVCSNRGTCDHATGVCRCDPGFTGASCDRMGCPGGCGKNGECRSMKYLATQKDAGAPPPVVYTQVWDSDMIYGCMCLDRHTGPDCSQTLCPTGDDPLTGFAGDLVFGQQVNEMQSVTCAATVRERLPSPSLALSVVYQAGTFTLSFRGLTTVPIQWNDPVAVFAAKLNALSSLAHVAVTYASTTLLACPPAGNVIAIEFLQDFGPQPLLVGNPASLVYTAVGGAVQLETTRLQAGTKENAPCSNRGTCDVGTGVCTCYAGFDTSDGYGNLGSRGDCGATTGPVANCPGTVTPCSGHGYCSGEPQYACLCYQGWTSGDCSIRTCPQGPAWFDTPTSSNDAHHDAICSNAGICNQATGLCECASGFEGAACQRLACPTSTAEPCSGHGQCLTQGRLSLQSTSWNGSPTPFTYGATPNHPMTWDAHHIQGCYCDNGFAGHDCALRTCAVGDNPRTTGQTNEMQVLICTATAPSTFQISFRGQTSGPIATTATAAHVASALGLVPAIGAVSVVFSAGATTVCTPAGTNLVQVTFLTTSGDVPPMTAVVANAVAIPSFLVATDGASGSIRGTTESDPCSGGGVCNHATGLCACFPDFAQSDERGQAGLSEDCGYLVPYQGDMIYYSYEDSA